MKYISYIIFIAFITLLLLFLKNALEPREEPLVIMGSKSCGECHSLKNLGNQQDVWERSRHKQAYNSLLTEKAKQFAAKHNIESPEKNKQCLKCHTTEFQFEGTGKSERYNISEGVGCESCHGAGSKFAPAHIMKDEYQFLQNGGLKGDKTCNSCHSPTANKQQQLRDDACPFQLEDFDYKTEFEKIKHPLNKDLND